ncbi:MAG: cobalt/nickel transport protein, partial [Ancylomarina sp.]
AGADGLAEDYITESQPNYVPWFSNIWEPPSAEIESLLFSLQAAIGTGVVAYVIGYYKGKKKAIKG